MKNLIETAKATKVPEKYELRASDLDTLYREAHGDVFRMISWAFKIGFHQGQKAKGGISMTKEDMIALGIPKDRMKDFRTRYFADVKKAAQRLNKSSEQSTDDVKKAIAALVQVIDDPEILHQILSYVASLHTGGDR